MTDTDFSKATERPWKLHMLDDTAIVPASGGPALASAEGDYSLQSDEMEANAALIVAAVNAFDPEREKKVEALVEAAEPIARYGDVLLGQWVRHDDVLIELWDHKITVGDLIRVAEALHSLKGGENG